MDRSLFVSVNLFYARHVREIVPGHALHDKGLQKQKGVGPLVSSQEHRALPVPVTNRLSSGCQPLVVFLHRFKWDFACSFFWRVVQEMFLRCLGRYEGHLSPGRNVLSASCSALPRSAAPPCAPTRAARGMSGFWIRQVSLFLFFVATLFFAVSDQWTALIVSKRVESKCWADHNMVRAAHGRAARQARVGQDGTPADLFLQKTTVYRSPERMKHTCPEGAKRCLDK